jgi:predicted branched-subunit amino acid permease
MALPGLASVPFGIGFGVAAAQKGIDTFETLLMSGMVMAGTAQMVALDLWARPLPLAALFITVFVANLRYFVMGAALQPYLPRLPWYRQLLVWYLTVDQNWAINYAECQRGQGDLGKFVGGGIVVASMWAASSLLGAVAANGVLADPAVVKRLGLDFVGVATFVVVAALLFKGKRDVAPWAVAVLVAIAAKYLLAGNWYIVVGGMAGGLFGAFLEMRRPEMKKNAP